MPILYRHQKGSPLTTAEVDGNFYEIVSRLESLEQKLTQSESIAKVEQKGDQLEVIGTFGTILGQVKLPTLKYTLRGQWTPKTAYAVQDVVAFNAQSWVCSVAHTSTDDFNLDFWTLLLDASQHQPSSSLLTNVPIFMENTLPNPILGQIGIYVSPDKNSFVFSDGKVWYTLQNENEMIIGEPTDD